jgi:hypothetical protein
MAFVLSTRYWTASIIIVIVDESARKTHYQEQSNGYDQLSLTTDQ